MTRFLSRGLAFALFAALFAAPVAFAQDAPPPAPQPQMEVATDFTDEELDAFAQAYIDIEAVQLRYQNEHGTIEDPTQAQQVQEQFQSEVFQILEQSAIDAERYEQVIMATQSDQEFAEGVLARIEMLRQG